MQNTPEILRVLLDAGFEFVVVGGVAAIAHGSSTFTADLDVVAPFTPENLARLLRAEGLDARFSTIPSQPLAARSAEELARFQNLYLETALGRVDILGTLSSVGDFSEVASRAASVALHGHVCRIASLEDLIRAKAALGRPKDRQVELELRAIRDRLKPG